MQGASASAAMVLTYISWNILVTVAVNGNSNWLNKQIYGLFHNDLWVMYVWIIGLTIYFILTLWILCGWVIRWCRVSDSRVDCVNKENTALLQGQTTMWWWRHQMETFSALLAICVGNSPVTCEFLAQRSFDVSFDLNKRLSKQSWGSWFEMPSRPLWRHCNGTRMPTAETPMFLTSPGSTFHRITQQMNDKNVFPCAEITSEVIPLMQFFFKVYPWKPKVNVMGKITNHTFISPLFHINGSTHSWITTILKFDLKIQIINVKSWLWSTFKVAEWVQHPSDSHLLRSMSIDGHGHEQVWRERLQVSSQKVTKSIHPWRRRWRWQRRRNRTKNT